jgi:hypothetical protein
MHLKFWWENLNEKKCLEGIYIDGSITLKWNLKKQCEVWTGFVWLRVGSGSSNSEYF